jgi:hypothetical protein
MGVRTYSARLAPPVTRPWGRTPVVQWSTASRGTPASAATRTPTAPFWRCRREFVDERDPVTPCGSGGLPDVVLLRVERESQDRPYARHEETDQRVPTNNCHARLRSAAPSTQPKPGYRPSCSPIRLLMRMCGSHPTRTSNPRVTRSATRALTPPPAVNAPSLDV